MAKTAESAHCVIGEGSVFDGKFYVSGSILIEGKFQGDIKTDDQVIVGPSGKVKTDIVAKKVTIAGTIIGNITATEEVNLLQTGKVLGNIVSPKVVMEPGVMTDGKVTITAGNGQNVKQAIEESFGPGTEDLFKTLTGGKKSTKKNNDDEK
jgi:cytoskeletal protein CcmA (bactofilin family)